MHTTAPTIEACSFCGNPLEPIIANLGGQEFIVSHKPCGCKKARDKRMAEIEAELKLEKEKREREIVETMRSAGVPKRYVSLSHEDADKYAKSVLEGQSLYIHGSVGTLKTTLACAIVRKIVEANVSVIFTSMYEVLGDIQDSFSGGKNPLPRYCKCRVLVLDDLGKEPPSEFVLGKLFELVDRRNRDCLQTIVTTNYVAGKLIERLSKNGDVDKAKAIVSRLRQDCISVPMSGDDRRKP